MGLLQNEATPLLMRRKARQAFLRNNAEGALERRETEPLKASRLFMQLRAVTAQQGAENKHNSQRDTHFVVKV